MKRMKRIGILFFSMFLFLSACSIPKEEGYESVRFVRIVDGDTILIDRGQHFEYVRLIGIDAPESVNPDPMRNSDDGRKSSDFLRDLLENVSLVYIVKDVSDTDKYGRLLRYVWMAKPSVDDEAKIRKNMVNAILLWEGYATQVTIQPDIAYAALFLGFVREAREKHAGLWE